jgi:hypothetical protein
MNMPLVAKVGVPTIATVNPPDSCRIGPLPVAEDVGAYDACYIGADGRVRRSTGAAANAAAVVDGFAANPALVAQRQTVTLYHDVNAAYGAGLAPGTFLYLSGTTPGGLDTGASVGGTMPIGRVIDANRVRVLRSY